MDCLCMVLNFKISEQKDDECCVEKTNYFTARAHDYRGVRTKPLKIHTCTDVNLTIVRFHAAYS